MNLKYECLLNWGFFEQIKTLLFSEDLSFLKPVIINCKLKGMPTEKNV